MTDERNENGHAQPASADNREGTSEVATTKNPSPQTVSIANGRVNLLQSALAKAGQLKMTDAEQRELLKAFPQTAVRYLQTKHARLAYLPHTEISRRLNNVLGIGQWTLIRTGYWYDDAEQIVYAEYALIVRGCWIGETIAGHKWVASNPQMDYGDALESTRGLALRRIAAKCLGVGDQVWPCDDHEAGQEERQADAVQQGYTAPRQSAESNILQAARIFARCKDASAIGTAALKQAWEEIGKEGRKILEGELQNLKDAASEADARNGMSGQTP